MVFIKVLVYLKAPHEFEQEKSILSREKATAKKLKRKAVSQNNCIKKCNRICNHPPNCKQIFGGKGSNFRRRC